MSIIGDIIQHSKNIKILTENIESVNTLPLKDNDIVVFSMKHTVSTQAEDRIIESLKKIFEKQGFKNIRPVVLMDGASLSIIRECGGVKDG